MPHTSLETFKFIKPLKRSQKVRLRKELEKRKKEEQNNSKLDGLSWKLTWENIKEQF